MIRITPSIVVMMLLFSNSVFAADNSVFNCKEDCSVAANPRYLAQGDVDLQRAHSIALCLENQAAETLDGPTVAEFRNFFEITGRLFEQTGPQKITPKNEQEQLQNAVLSGYSQYAWLIGATDCQTHALNLIKHLKATVDNDGNEYKFELVNTFQDFDSKQFADFDGVLLPGANHYVVRAVSMRTGRSYILDGYTIPSTTPEPELHGEKIILTNYEECIYPKVIKAKLGLAQDNILAMAASFTPMLRSTIARESVRIANTCLSGTESTIIQTDILP